MEMDREAMGGRERQRMAAKTIMIMLMINNDTQSLSPQSLFLFLSVSTDQPYLEERPEGDVCSVSQREEDEDGNSSG